MIWPLLPAAWGALPPRRARRAGVCGRAVGVPARPDAWGGRARGHGYGGSAACRDEQALRPGIVPGQRDHGGAACRSAGAAATTTPFAALLLGCHKIIEALPLLIFGGSATLAAEPCAAVLAADDVAAFSAVFAALSAAFCLHLRRPCSRHQRQHPSRRPRHRPPFRWPKKSTGNSRVAS